MGKLGDLLLKEGVITDEQLKKALALQAGGNRRLGAILIKMGAITEDQLCDILSEQSGVFKTTDYLRVDDDVKSIMPRHLCVMYSMVPLCLEDGVLACAMTNPLDEKAIDDVEYLTGKIVKPMLAKKSMVDTAIKDQISLGIADVVNKYNAEKLAKLVLVVLLTVFVSAVAFYSKLTHEQRYGVRHVDGNSTSYTNKDVTLIKHSDGYALIGRGTHAGGGFQVKFGTKEQMEDFIEKKKKLFSTDQREYLEYALYDE